MWRPSNGTWYIIRSTDGQFDFRTWGIALDIPVPGDYDDGDGKYDIAAVRDGVWYIFQSQTGTLRVIFWGVSSNVPLSRKNLP